MTIRDLYDHALTEMNKVEAPSLLLEDYNYFINKAVQQYINKVYNRYDINQQSSDDLRVLKATAQLQLKKVVNGKQGKKDRFVYECEMPDDYMHILNCIVEFAVKKPFSCYNTGDRVSFAAKRLTADMAAGILRNVYMKPDYKRPYFYINNVDLLKTSVSDQVTPFDEKKPTFKEVNPYSSADVGPKNSGTTAPAMPENTTDPAAMGQWAIQYAAWLNNEDSKGDTVKEENTRDSNSSKVRIEIRFGDDDTVFVPEYVYIDYIKSPMFIRLTYDQTISTIDTTRELEFPDYVCYEIINEFVKLLMENSSDPRLQTNYPINQTIANPLAAQESQSRDKS